MSVYNGERFLKQAIDSILSQTFIDFEFIIVDDASTDGTPALLDQYQDTRIRRLKNQQNRGLTRSLNMALQAATGEYIARQDADDISLTQRLEKEVAFLDSHPEVGLVSSECVLIDENKAVVGTSQGVGPIQGKVAQWALLWTNIIVHSSVLARRDILIAAGGYSEEYRYSQDYALWLRLADSTSLSVLNDQLVMLRRHSQQVSAHFKGPQVGAALGLSQRAISGLTGFTPSQAVLQVTMQLCPPETDRLMAEACRIIESSCRAFLARNRLSGQEAVEIRTMASWRLVKLISSRRRPLSSAAIRVALSAMRLAPGWRSRSRLIRKVMKSAIKRGLVLSGRLLGAILPRQNRSGIFFFFPYYHMGGAEKVHAAIVSSVSDLSPWVFFTEISVNGAYKHLFEGKARLFDLSPLTSKPTFHYLFAGLLASVINKHKKAVVFASSSQIFYLMLPYIKPHVRRIDLVHAFGGGIEDTSLPHAALLDTRVVINRKTVGDFAQQYRAAGLDQTLVDRIELIENCVKVPATYPAKAMNGPLTVLYVGGPGDEKRVHLVGRVAARCVRANVPARFVFVGGNLASAVEEGDRQYASFEGEIVSSRQLEAIYERAHLILLASSHEGFPLAVMEAMAHGVVPLSTCVGGIPEHVTHGVNGLLVPNESEIQLVDALVQAIESLAADRLRLDRLSRSAYEYASEHFGPERFYSAYRKLLTRQPAKSEPKAISVNTARRPLHED